MKRIVLLVMATFIVISLFGCARKGEIVQEQVGKFHEEVQAPMEEEWLDMDEPSAPKEPSVKLERLDEASIPKEIMELFDHSVVEQNIIYYTSDAAKKLDCKEEKGIADVAEMSTRYSDHFDEENLENWNLIIGSALDVRAGGEEQVYVPVEVNDIIQGTLNKEMILISRRIALTTDYYGNEYFESFGSQDLDMILLSEKPALYVLEGNDGIENNYCCPIPVINLPEDYQDFDGEYVSELLDYYRGAQYKSEENKGPTTTEDGEVIYHFSWNPYEEYENYTDEQMMELLEDQLLVQLALRYKIKIWPQDNPMLAVLEVET